MKRNPAITAALDGARRWWQVGEGGGQVRTAAGHRRRAHGDCEPRDPAHPLDGRLGARDGWPDPRDPALPRLGQAHDRRPAAALETRTEGTPLSPAGGSLTGCPEPLPVACWRRSRGVSGHPARLGRRALRRRPRPVATEAAEDDLSPVVVDSQPPRRRARRAVRARQPHRQRAGGRPAGGSPGVRPRTRGRCPMIPAGRVRFPGRGRLAGEPGPGSMPPRAPTGSGGTPRSSWGQNHGPAQVARGTHASPSCGRGRRAMAASPSAPCRRVSSS